MNFDVNKLRNSCAQNDAKVIEKDGKPIKAIDELIIDGTVNGSGTINKLILR
tara:strand:- start:407 stop:562 length:156 start_codon:yes stop_codon:yes gene_type:complete